jgi:outer membrane protein OmpA-like peptidoglycan-associated protein
VPVLTSILECRVRTPGIAEIGLLTASLKNSHPNLSIRGNAELRAVLKEFLMKSHYSILIVLVCSCVVAQQTGLQSPNNTSSTPTFHVTVVSRSVSAVNYRHHSGSTTLDFRGTNLMPEAKGRAKVESRTGRIQVEADLEHLRKPQSIGPEFLTYVLWAITPEGRAANLGEVMPNEDGKASLTVSTDLQAFGMVVTAEPYFAVTRPSNEVILENEVKPDTKGWEMPITAKYELLERGGNTLNLSPTQLPSAASDPKTPNDLLQARNAVAIARAAGAERYAPDALRKAEDFLNRAEDYLRRNQGSKAIGTVARGAVQSAEDARLVSVQRAEQEYQEAQRRAEQQRANEAQVRAQQAQQQAQIETQQRQLAEQERQRAQEELQAAQQARAQAEQERQQAEAARQAALAQQQTAQSVAQQAQFAAQRAEQEKEQTRQQLLQQLNQVMQTRETARGLIVNMPDVLFDTGKYTLKAGARERLARVAGILQAYPGLRVQIEGHTDSTGTADFNQRLSEHRAEAVRDFLQTQGVSRDLVTAQGFGQTAPVASNATAEGRQLNRRVDLVVSGEAISQSTTTTNTTTTSSGGVTPSTAPAAVSGSTSVNGVPSTTSPASVPATSVPNNSGSSNTLPPPSSDRMQTENPPPHL